MASHTVTVDESAASLGYRVGTAMPTLTQSLTETEAQVAEGHMFFLNDRDALDGISGISVTSDGAEVSPRTNSSFYDAPWTAYVMPASDVLVSWSDSFGDDEIPPG